VPGENCAVGLESIADVKGPATLLENAVYSRTAYARASRPQRPRIPVRALTETRSRLGSVNGFNIFRPFRARVFTNSPFTSEEQRAAL